MKLTVADPKFLKEGISIVSDLVNEVKIKFSENGLELVAMDPANVSMVIFTLLRNNFVEYEAPDNPEISISLTSFKQILKRAKPADSITLELGSDNRLKILFRGKNKRTFYLPLIEIDEKEQKEPDLKFAMIVETEASSFSDAISDVDVIGETVAFTADASSLVISSEDELSKADVEFKDDETTSITADTEDKIKARYSIDYLKKMIGADKIAPKVKIMFSADYPLKLQYLVQDKLQLSFVLAPRGDQD